MSCFPCFGGGKKKEKEKESSSSDEESNHVPSSNAKPGDLSIYNTIRRVQMDSLQGKEILVGVLMLSLLHHPNLVSLVGYCADGDQRLLVYEFITNGSLKDPLLEMKHKSD